jgi:hypothetical protein
VSSEVKEKANCLAFVGSERPQRCLASTPNREGWAAKIPRDDEELFVAPTAHLHHRKTLTSVSVFLCLGVLHMEVYNQTNFLRMNIWLLAILLFGGLCLYQFWHMSNEYVSKQRQ